MTNLIIFTIPLFHIKNWDPVKKEWPIHSAKSRKRHPWTMPKFAHANLGGVEIVRLMKNVVRLLNKF